MVLIKKSAEDDWEEPRISTFCEASFGGVKRKLLLDRVGESPAGTAEHEFNRVRIEGGQAAKTMLRVKGALDACRLKPVPCDGYVDIDAMRLAVSRGSGISVSTQTRFFSFLGAASNFAAWGVYNRKRDRYHNQGYSLRYVTKNSAKQILILTQCPWPAP